MKQALKKFFGMYFPAIAYFVLVFFLFQNHARAQRDFAQLSARYSETPLSAAQVESARNALENPKKTFDFSATFWSQQQNQPVSAGTRSATTTAMLVNGEASAALPAYFLYGDYPSAADRYGVAVSEGLAWELWGGMNLVGAEMQWNGQTYTVRGVFEGNDLMMLVQVNPAALASAGGEELEGGAGFSGSQYTFDGVELTGGATGDVRTAAGQLLADIGLPEPTVYISNPSLVGMMAFAAWLPAVMLMVWFLVKLLARIHKMGFWGRQLVWFGILIACAFLIPYLLGRLPVWLIPNRWSNMQHWSTASRELGSRITDWLMLVPSLKDLMLKRMLLLQFLLLVPALFAATGTIRKWNRRMTDAVARVLPLPKPKPAVQAADASADEATADESGDAAPQMDGREDVAGEMAEPESESGVAAGGLPQELLEMRGEEEGVAAGQPEPEEDVPEAVEHAPGP